MSNMLGAQTVSETIQKELKRKKCPLIMECSKMINKFLFKHYCNSVNHINCFEFSKTVNEITTPRAWLQTLAIKESEEE